MEITKPSISQLLEELDDGVSSIRLTEIAQKVKDQLTLPPDLFGSIPCLVYDFTLISCLIKTLNDLPIDALSKGKKQEMCRHLSTVCVHLLQPTSQLTEKCVLDILRAIREFLLNGVPTVPKETKKLYRLLNSKVEKGTYSQKVEKELWRCSYVTFETTLLKLFCSATAESQESRWQSIAKECALCPKLFRNAISIVASICRTSKGNVAIMRTARHFFRTMFKNVHEPDALLYSFPDNLRSLVIALSLPWKHMPSEIILAYLDHLCELALNGIEKELWSVRDIGMLALVMPDWYEILLEANSASKASPLARNLLAVLWQFNCPYWEEHLTTALKEIRFS